MHEQYKQLKESTEAKLKATPKPDHEDLEYYLLFKIYDMMHEAKNAHKMHKHKNYDVSMAGHNINENMGHFGVVDIIPEVQTDNKIQHLLDLFVDYYHKKQAYRTMRSEHNKHTMLEALKIYFKAYKDIYGLLWSDTDCPEERTILEQYHKEK